MAHSNSFSVAEALAASLPGHPDYRGDAAYVFDTGAGLVAALKSGLQLTIMEGDAAGIEAEARRRELPIQYVAPEATTWQLASSQTRQRIAVERMTNRLGRIAAYAIGVCATVYLCALAGGEYVARTGWRYTNPQQLADSVSRLQYTSPMFEQLAHFQQISATVVRSGGWIEGYVWRPSQGEAFEIVMPGWISQDYIEALGPGAIADYNLPDNLVTVRRGNIEKLRKP